MSLSKKRNLQDLSTDKNNKRLKNDSAIDLNFDVGQSNHQSANSSSESLINDDSMLNDDVFEDQSNLMTSSMKNTSQNRGRKRLNGTSTYPTAKIQSNRRQSKRLEKENLLIDQTLNQLREEQARIDAHSLSTNVK